MQAEESVKILFSARDPGAAAHIREIATQAVQRDDLEAVVLAAPPGLEILRDAGLAVREFRAGPVKGAADPGARELLGEARARLEELRPDAIVVGTSGPERGVDEALIACAQTPHTYAIQDYPGWVVSGFGRAANTYFVLDEAMANLTEGRHGVRAMVAGSPKHAAYRTIDPLRLRAEGRNRARDNSPVIGFFGQPIWFLDGYARTLEKLADAAAGSVPGAVLFYRPHPKETSEARAMALDLIRRPELETFLDVEPRVEASLSVADMVCTCYSSCGMDHMFLQRKARHPLGTVTYMMFESDLSEHHRRETDLDLPPLAGEDLALIVRQEAELSSVLDAALSPSIQHRVWTTARTHLPDPDNSPRTILDAVRSDISKGRARLLRASS